MLGYRPVPVLASLQQRGDGEGLAQPPGLHLLHQHGLLAAPHPDEAAVVAQVGALPEAEAGAQVVEPRLVELARGEGGGGPQDHPVVHPGPRHPHLLLLHQLPAPAAHQRHGAQVPRGEVAQHLHHHLGGQLQQALHPSGVSQQHSHIHPFRKLKADY